MYTHKLLGAFVGFSRFQLTLDKCYSQICHAIAHLDICTCCIAEHNPLYHIVSHDRLERDATGTLLQVRISLSWHKHP